MKLDSSVKEKFEGEARSADCSNLTVFLKQADYSPVSGLSYREY